MVLLHGCSTTTDIRPIAKEVEGILQPIDLKPSYLKLKRIEYVRM